MKHKENLLLLLIMFFTFATNAQVLTVEITNIRNNKGNIALAVFTDNASFRAEKPYIDKIYPKKNIKNGKLIVKIKIKPGIYGISILDDENCDGKMNYNRIRVPKEGFGFSNYVHKGLKRPKFSNFDFTVSNKNKRVSVIMKYL